MCGRGLCLSERVINKQSVGRKHLLVYVQKKRKFRASVQQKTQLMRQRCHEVIGTVYSRHLMSTGTFFLKRKKKKTCLTSKSVITDAIIEHLCCESPEVSIFALVRVHRTRYQMKTHPTVSSLPSLILVLRGKFTPRHCQITAFCSKS